MLQTAIMWASFLWVIPIFIWNLEVRLGIAGFAPMARFGWILFVLASSLGQWSAWAMTWHGEGTPLPFDTARRFVVAGPYRWVRNPMALAGLAQGIAVGLILGSFTVLTLPVAGGIFWQYLVRPFEEADLAARFGVPYAEYRAKVSCWWPGWPYVPLSLRPKN